MAQPLMSLDVLHQNAARSQIMAPRTMTAAGLARGPDVLLVVSSIASAACPIVYWALPWFSEPYSMPAPLVEA
jgi:hypothetical protein